MTPAPLLRWCGRARCSLRLAVEPLLDQHNNNLPITQNQHPPAVGTLPRQFFI